MKGAADMNKQSFTSVILTPERKARFEKNGVEPKDWTQIAYAMRANNTKYHYFNGETERVISRSEAISLLGEDVFLSGIIRSAFHWSAVREIANSKYKQYVRFDSSKMFKS